MIATMFQTMTRVGILLILVAVGWQEAAAQPACTRGVFVYLDVSGSMYDTNYNPKVVYRQQQMYLLDAMLEFADTTFGNSTLLQRGDYFSFNVFAESVQSFREFESLSDDDIRSLQGLHEAFDQDGNGTVGMADLAALNLNVNPQRTSFVALLDRIKRDVDAFHSRRQGGEAVSVMVFTDARYDPRMDSSAAVTARLDVFVEDFRGSLNEGSFTFMFIPLVETEVTLTFEELSPPFLVRDFVLAATTDGAGLISDVQSQIQQTLQDKLVIIQRESIPNAPVEGKEDWYRFAIPVRNLSCFNGDMLFSIYYEIRSEKLGKPYSSGFDRSKEFRAYGRDTVSVDLDFSKFPDGVYLVGFELSDRRGGGTTLGAVAFTKGESGLSGFVWVLIFVGIAAVVGAIVLLVMSNKESRFSP